MTNLVEVIDSEAVTKAAINCYVAYNHKRNSQKRFPDFQTPYNTSFIICLNCCGFGDERKNYKQRKMRPCNR